MDREQDRGEFMQENASQDSTLPTAPPTFDEATPAPAGPESHAFRFTGQASEYFGIWIVNLFLSIITLGIYSAWAKVRKKRYFYGHTWVAEANFEYHGNPIAILKGRVIAFIAFASYSALGHFMPKVAAALAVALFIAAPWFIARSMAFNAHNSSYRNIRFRFQATYMDVLKCIGPIALVLVFPFLMPDWDPASKESPPTSFWAVLVMQTLSLFAVYPYVVGSLKRLHVNHSQYGVAPFSITVGLGAFYKIYLLALLLAVVAIIVVSAIGGAIAGVIGMFGTGGMKMAALTLFVIPILVLGFYFGMGALMFAFTKSRMGNLVFNNSSLDQQVYFTSNLQARRLFRIYFTNLLAILFSLGLAIPWATIRVMRYRAECLSLRAESSLDELIAGIGANVGATGEELGEFFNVDLSL
jgi:uncharacterized membrane protein YjgN (DUF898 family)